LGAFRDGETCIESIVVFKGWIASCVGVSMVLSMASRLTGVGSGLLVFMKV
jgi:hypothetical protein